MYEDEALKQCKDLYKIARDIVNQVREDNPDADDDTLLEYAAEQVSGDVNVIYNANAIAIVTDTLTCPDTWSAFKETDYYGILIDWTREGRAADMHGSPSFDAGEIWDNLNSVAELLLSWAVGVVIDLDDTPRVDTDIQ